MIVDGFSYRPEWTAKAACHDALPETFFPTSMDDAGPAKKICETCPVARDCLRYALDTEQRWGIWGGSTPRQRKRLLKKLGKHQEPDEPNPPRPPGGQAAVNALKTHCKNNHEFTPENTAHYRGRRSCITCHEDRLERQRARRRQLKEAKA